MAKTKRGPGRPQKLTPELQKDLCDRLKVCGTAVEAATAAGISYSTLMSWKARGETEKANPRSKYVKFLEAVKQAYVERRFLREQQIVKHGTKDWRALWALMVASDPKRYAPRVRVHIEEELSGAIERLSQAFAGEPEILERILSALAGDAGGGEAGEDPFGEDGADDPAGGEAVQPAPAEQKAAVVP